MENHGKIDVASIIAMGGQVQTGDILSCIYDLEVTEKKLQWDKKPKVSKNPQVQVFDPSPSDPCWR